MRTPFGTRRLSSQTANLGLLLVAAGQARAPWSRPGAPPASDPFAGSRLSPGEELHLPALITPPKRDSAGAELLILDQELLPTSILYLLSTI